METIITPDNLQVIEEYIKISKQKKIFKSNKKESKQLCWNDTRTIFNYYFTC